MTVASEINRSGPYTGNGVTTVFDYDFRIVSENHIKVIRANLSGVETVLTIDADYIVSDVGNPAGGQIALTVPLISGYKLTLLRNVPFTQEVDLQNQGAYYAETVEGAFDLAAMRDQELQEQINRAVTIPPSEDPAQLGGLVQDILRLADSADNIDVVAGSIANVNAVAGNAANVNDVAANMPAVIAAPSAAAAAAASADDAAASAASTGIKAPLVILTTGQSNMANRIPLAWVPSANFKAWDFWGQISADNVVGTQFAQPDTTRMGLAFAMCDKIARNTGRLVYLIDVSVGGKAIADWSAAPPTYNFRQAIANNVTAALAALGLSKVDMLAWWQGESDGSNQSTTYVSDFEDVMTWFKTQAWFEEATPVLMFGLPPYAQAPNDSGIYHWLKYTAAIKACVAKEPGTRRFIDTQGLPITRWEPSDSIKYIHLTALGYLEVGEKAADAVLYSMYEPTFPYAVRNPGTGTMTFGATAGGLPHLAFGAAFDSYDWIFRKDTPGAADILRFLIQNGGAGDASLVVQAGAGAWSITSNDATTNFGSLFWGGANGALIAATNAAGMLDFAAGGFTTRLSIRGDGLYFSPGTAAPASLPNGGVAPVFVDAETVKIVGRSGAVNREKLLRLKPSSGVYNPTFSSLSNLDSATGFNWRWTRVDDIVTVVGQATQDATAAGAYSYEVTLPVNAAANPTFVSGLDCGVGSGENGIVLAVAGANRAKVQGASVLTTATTHTVMFSYGVAQADG